MRNFNLVQCFCLVLLFELSSSMRRPPRPYHPPRKASAPKEKIDQPFIFTMTAPKVLHPHSTFPLTLSLDRGIGPVEFDFKISTIKTDGQVNKTIEVITKGQTTMEPEASAVVELRVDTLLVDQTYNLTVDAYCVESHHTASDHGLVYVHKKAFSILIQTDKPIYKPGEKVQFRVLLVDRFLKPVAIDLSSRKLSIEIFDAQRNLIKSWKGKDIPLQPKFGFVKETLQLSKEPNLGDWSIEVVSSILMKSGGEEGEEERETLSFSIEQYVLPKFKVEAKTIPSFITYNDSSFSVEVKSLYTHGKGVNGLCSVLLKPTYIPYYWNNQPSKEEANLRPIQMTKSKDVKGTGLIQFNLREDIRVKEEDASDWGFEYELQVSCTEEATGKVENTTTHIKLYKYPWKIETVHNPTNYKPGFPLTLVIKVARHDDTPVFDDNLEALKIRHGFSYNAEGGVLYRPIPSSGLVSVTFTPPTNDLINVNGMEVFYKGFKQVLGVPYRQTSPTNSFMVVNLLNNRDDPKKVSLFVGDTAVIHVKVNKPFEYLNWILVARGVIEKWDKVKLPQPQQEYTLSIPLEEATESHATLVIYTVLSQDDDVLAESMEIEVKGLDQKFFSVVVKDYSQENRTVEPGTNITIACRELLQGSLLALRGVDQSVLLLKSNKDIDSQAVKNVEDQFVSSLNSMRSWGGSDIYQIFENNGVNILTNALLTKSETVQVAYSGMAYYGVASIESARAMPMMMKMSAAPMAMAGRGFMADEASNSGAGGGGGGGGPEPVIRMRSAFPETWLFSEVEVETPITNILETVPDTITSWIISAFQISPTQGLRLTKSVTTLTTFRPFFIVLTLPYSVIRGEVFPLKVLIHNYIGYSTGARVLLDNQNNEFTLSPTDEQRSGSELVKRVDTIEPNSVGVVTYLINPSKVGTISLSLKGVTSSNEAGDGVTQPLIVKPPGVKQCQSDAAFLNLLNAKGRRVAKNLTALLPEVRVPDGDTLKVTIIGDILGGSIRHLDRLVQLPHGCGEQNMVHFVPDIVVLDYLKEVDALPVEVKERAIQFLEQGYQTELTFKRFDGSFSAFGNSDAEGSTWLTAFVVRSFIQAKRYISIDDTVLSGALNFLIQQQSENGSFVQGGYVHDTSILGGAGNNNAQALAAFVLLAFIEAKTVPHLQDLSGPKNYTGVMDTGLHWLLAQEMHDTYAIAITTYLLHLLDHPEKDAYFQQLEQRTVTDGKTGFKFWEATKKKVQRQHIQHRKGASWIDDDIDDGWDEWSYFSVRPATVEITSYALLIYLMREGGSDGQGELKDSILIARWLLKQRNEYGGFISTQDTVVGLTALGKFARATFTPNFDLTVKVTFPRDEGEGYAFRIDKDNMASLQEYFLPPGVKEVNVVAEGTGSALAQLSWTYYTMNGNNTAFDLDIKAEPKDKNRRLEMEICTTYTAGTVSNMAILEIDTPTGYAFDQEEVYELKKKEPKIKRHELENSDSKLNIYFDSLGQKATCINLTLHRVHFVAKLAKAAVVVYDYYDTTRKATKLYDGPKIDVCQICSLDDSCKERKCV